MLEIITDSPEVLTLKYSRWNTSWTTRLVVYVPPIAFLFVIFAFRYTFDYQLPIRIILLWAFIGSLLLVRDFYKDIIWRFDKSTQRVDCIHDPAIYYTPFSIYKYIVAKRLFGSFRFDQVEQVVVQARELDEEGLEYRLALVIPVDTLYKNGYPLIPPFYSGALVPEVAEKVRVIMNKEQVVNVDIPLIV